MNLVDKISEAYRTSRYVTEGNTHTAKWYRQGNGLVSVGVIITIPGKIAATTSNVNMTEDQAERFVAVSLNSFLKGITSERSDW